MVGGPRRLLAAALFAFAVTGCTKNTIQSASAPTPAPVPPPTPAPIARLAVSISGTDGLVALAGQSVVTTDTAAVSVSVADARGRWMHSFYNPRTFRYEYRELKISSQAGGALAGFYRHPEGAETPLRGELVGERGFRVYSPDGFIEFSSTAEGISASGLIVRMNVRGGSADGLTLLFSRTGLAAP